MSTKVFISWSGELSKNLANAIYTWLPATLQYVEPYFSPDDIEKGTKWSSEISKELNESDIGIICLTKDNINNPWILFESGALSKSIDRSRVCTILFNVDTSDITGPLINFQATRFIKNDFLGLIKTINNNCDDTRLSSNVINAVFEVWWPRLEKEVRDILKSSNKNTSKSIRSDRDIIEEILFLSRKSIEIVHEKSRRTIGQLESLLRILIPLLDAMPDNAQIPVDIINNIINEIRLDIKNINYSDRHFALYREFKEILASKFDIHIYDNSLDQKGVLYTPYMGRKNSVDIIVNDNLA